MFDGKLTALSFLASAYSLLQELFYFETLHSLLTAYKSLPASRQRLAGAPDKPSKNMTAMMLNSTCRAFCERNVSCPSSKREGI